MFDNRQLYTCVKVGSEGSLQKELRAQCKPPPRHVQNLQAHAEAFMPASSNHFTILFLAKILYTKIRYDFRFLATVP